MTGRNQHTAATGVITEMATGLGFDYSYGFIGGDVNQWRSVLFENTHPIEAPGQQGQQPEHMDRLLADRAIGWIRTQHALEPNKAMFAYYTPGTSHAPHQAPWEWIAKFKGQFDQGWNKQREETFARQKKLGVIPTRAKRTPRSTGIPAWDSLKRRPEETPRAHDGGISLKDLQPGRQ